VPELPEVETIRRGLDKYVVGHRILDVDIKAPRIFSGDKENVIGAKIVSVRRLGKGLILNLDNNYSLAIHIKMTGQLIYRGKETEDIEISKTKVGSVPNKFTHVIFELDGSPSAGSGSSDSKNPTTKLYYNDQRRFGWIKVVPTKDVMDLTFFKTVGPEPPISPDSHEHELTLEMFKKVLNGKPTKIKPLIMDQARIGGIGNIYANDALFKARIDPRRPAKSLTDKEIEMLYKSVIDVMKLSLEKGGASELSYVNVLGNEGSYQRYSLVYGEKGKPCKNCGTKIEFEKLGGRGTFYCPKCQK